MHSVENVILILKETDMIKNLKYGDTVYVQINNSYCMPEEFNKLTFFRGKYGSAKERGIGITEINETKNTSVCIPKDNIKRMFRITGVNV